MVAGASKPEQRRHPRVEVVASVEIENGDKAVVLDVRNISVGGVYLLAGPLDRVGFEPGGLHNALIVDAVDDTTPSVRVIGRVVRVDELGVALVWEEPREDSPGAVLLGALIEELRARLALTTKP